MRETTWRWYRTYIEWEKRRWPREEGIDFATDDPEVYLLARIAQRVQQVLSSSPSQIRLEDQFIQFIEKGEEEKPLTREEAAKRSKAMFMGMVGGRKGIIMKTRPRKKNSG